MCRIFRSLRVMVSMALLASATPGLAVSEHIPSSRAALVKGSCSPERMKITVATDFNTTTSKTFVRVTNSQISFTQGGTAPSCVIVSFTSEASAAANEVMRMRVLLDSSTTCLPDDNIFVRSNATVTDLADRAMNFVCPDIAPGDHDVQVQYRSTNGGSVSLAFRTQIVNYKK